MTDEQVPVTQADRDAAHALMRIVRGHSVNLPLDGHFATQAFARHRIATEASRTGSEAVLDDGGESVTAAAKRMVAVQGTDWATLDGRHIGHWESLAAAALQEPQS